MKYLARLGDYEDSALSTLTQPLREAERLYECLCRVAEESIRKAELRPEAGIAFGRISGQAVDGEACRCERFEFVAEEACLFGAYAGSAYVLDGHGVFRQLTARCVLLWIGKYDHSTFALI